jgi:hypothetical protein
VLRFVPLPLVATACAAPEPAQVCAAEDRPAATIVRDRDLVPRTDSGWFYLRRN